MPEAVRSEQGTLARYPPSPHPNLLGAPGSAGSPRLMHAPKKSALRPRGSRASGSGSQGSSPRVAISATEQSDSAAPESLASDWSALSDGAGSARQPSVGASRASAAHSGPIDRPRLAPHRTSRASAMNVGAQKTSSGSRHARSEPDQDAPGTPKSPTALHAKLRRLRAKWSTLAAERGHAHPSNSTASDGKSSSLDAGPGRVTVSVTAGPPLTVIALDEIDSPELTGSPGSTDRVSSTAETYPTAVARLETGAFGSELPDDEESSQVSSSLHTRQGEGASHSRDSESIVHFQGNGLYEKDTSTLQVQNLRHFTQPQCAQHARVTHSTVPSASEVRADEPKAEPLLRFASGRAAGAGAAQPAQQGGGFTLDQQLSSVSRESPHGAESGAAAQLAQVRNLEAENGSKPESSSGTADSFQKGDSKADRASRILARGTSAPVFQANIDEEAPRQQAGVLHGIGMEAWAPDEPANLDRGEPTFEEGIRARQHVRTRGANWAGQLLAPRKQARTQQQSHDARFPRRSCSPFSRLSKSRRAKSGKPERTKHDSISAGTQTGGTVVETGRSAASASGPGPLERGMHETELGGYYLTTPDPLRRDPGFGATLGRHTSEQSAHSAAQHGQRGTDPLNCDPVQYVSSPAWRMSTLEALDSLQTNVGSDTALDPSLDAKHDTAHARDATKSARSAQGNDALQSIHLHTGQDSHTHQSSSKRGAEARHRHRNEYKSSRKDYEDNGCNNSEPAPPRDRSASQRRSNSRSRHSSSALTSKHWTARTEKQRAYRHAPENASPTGSATTVTEVCTLPTLQPLTS